MKRLLLISLVVLLLIQGGSWFVIGQSRLPELVSGDILELTGAHFFLNEQSLEAAPKRVRSVLRDRLLASPSVVNEDDLPADNREELGRTGSGEPLYSYKTPHFGLTNWVSTPLLANVEFSVYQAPLGAKGLQVRYFWVMGFWVRRSSQNPTWIS